jgi:FMN phosphatase YigB (HAD superfamily)
MSKIILTDCDGVLLQWEKAFHEWMELNGFEQIGKGHYDIDMMYHLPQGFSKTLIKIFNESAWMGYLEPMPGSVEAVKQLAEEGYKFTVITSQSTDPVANKLRKQNLKDHFGDVFEDFVFLDTGAGKLEALSKYKSSNMFWIEDKPQNAFTGATQGLVALLLDLPHNAGYNSDNELPVRRVMNWQEIYNVIKEKNHGNT